MNGMTVGRMIIALGAVLIIVGALVMAASRLGLGRLPGDILIRRGGFTVYFPLATSIIVSLLLTLLLTLAAGLWRR